MDDQAIFDQYQMALAKANPTEQIKILQGIGISSIHRRGDLKSYIPLVRRPNSTDPIYQTDFELLSQVSPEYHSELEKIPTRAELIQRINNLNTGSSEYSQCLTDAQARHQTGDLNLCPEGYCTAKLKFEVYPSAYANAYASQVCKGSKPDYSGNVENYYGQEPKPTDSSLTRWFDEKCVSSGVE